jgi:hypothetical protein
MYFVHIPQFRKSTYDVFQFYQRQYIELALLSAIFCDKDKYFKYRINSSSSP